MDKFIIRQKRKIHAGDDEVELNNNPKHLKKEIENTSNSGNETRIETTKSPLLKKLTDEGLDCDYYRLYTNQQADEILRQCEEQLVFNSGREAQVRVFGKWHKIRRKQVKIIVHYIENLR